MTRPRMSAIFRVPAGKSESMFGSAAWADVSSSKQTATEYTQSWKRFMVPPLAIECAGRSRARRITKNP